MKEISDDIIDKRLQFLQYAEKTGNVPEACKIFGISRTQYYEYKKRYKKYGRDGLANFPPIHYTHPNKLSKMVLRQIIKLSYMNPEWGCKILSQQLKQHGISVSYQTIQKVLNRLGMGTEEERVRKCKVEENSDGNNLTEK
jgi:transposase